MIIRIWIFIENIWRFILKSFLISATLIILGIISIRFLSHPYQLAHFLESLHAGTYSNYITVTTSIFSLFIINIIGNAPQWFEWLNEYELTFGAKNFKNISQFTIVGSNLGLFIWQREPIQTMVSENHLKAINLYSNFDNLTFSILLGMFISLIVFGCLTLILFKLRKRYDKVFTSGPITIKGTKCPVGPKPFIIKPKGYPE